VLMRRFDALKPHREALGNIVFDQARDPVSALCGLGRLERSMAAMLEAARLSAGGLRGLLRAKALGWVYLATLRVFLSDDSSDLAATMAALDRNLRRLDCLARGCSRTRYPTAAATQ
ncbi:MAG: TetR/AcrR family transcriptional regulator, partial [Kiloniellales bacterium]